MQVYGAVVLYGADGVSGKLLSIGCWIRYYVKYDIKRTEYQQENMEPYYIHGMDPYC